MVGHKAEEVKKAIGNRDVTFTLQQQQLGTGHAVMQAIDFIEDDKNILTVKTWDKLMEIMSVS